MEPHSAGVPVIEAVGISKHFGPVQALRGVDLSVHAGEVVALVGDNGAGKSTLVKILCGAQRPTSGSILLDGHAVSFNSPLDARAVGIEAVYQDLALAPHLPVWGNIFLGRDQLVPGLGRKFGWLDRKFMINAARENLARTKITIGSVTQITGKLSGGQRQAVAVARAVAWGSRIVLMDEPTAALGVEQQAEVGGLIRTVAQTGTPVLLISHNLNQVYELCDRILVLFHGQVIADLTSATASLEDIISYITGAALRKGTNGTS